MFWDKECFYSQADYITAQNNLFKTSCTKVLEAYQKDGFRRRNQSRLLY